MITSEGLRRVASLAECPLRFTRVLSTPHLTCRALLYQYTVEIPSVYVRPKKFYGVDRKVILMSRLSHYYEGRISSYDVL